MIWLAKTVNDRLNVVETLRFQTVKKRFACVPVDMKNAVTTVQKRQKQYWSLVLIKSLVMGRTPFNPYIFYIVKLEFTEI